MPVQKRQHAFGPAAARPPESCQAQLQGSPERGTEDHPAQQGRDCRQPARCRLQCPRIASLRLRFSARVLEALTISRGAETPQGFPVVAGDSTVWARHLTGGDIAVALYNEDDAPKSIGAPFAALGWTATTKATVKDLWGNHSAASPAVPATATGKIGNVTVRPHSTVMLRLTKA